MNEQKRYVFIKDYKTTEGTIQEGRMIDIVHGCMYLDGGLLSNFYSNRFMELINNPTLKAEYLKESVIPRNKV